MKYWQVSERISEIEQEMMTTKGRYTYTLLAGKLEAYQEMEEEMLKDAQEVCIEDILQNTFNT